MKTKSLFIATILSMAIFAACTDKKKTVEQTETEVIIEEVKTNVDETEDIDEKRRQDSIRQVKEHGHAH